MSVRLNDSVTNERLEHGTIAGASTDFSFCWWFNFNDQNNFTCFLWYGTDDNNDSLYLGTDSDGTLPLVFQWSLNRATGTQLTGGRWYFGAYEGNTATMTSFNWYIYDSVALTSQTLSGTLSSIQGINDIGTNPLIEVGNDRFTEPMDGSVAAFKHWDSVRLTQAEFEQEMGFYVPVTNQANLRQWNPWFSTNDLDDYSGNARNFTGTNAPTDGVISPPIRWAPGGIFGMQVPGVAAPGPTNIYTQGLLGVGH